MDSIALYSFGQDIRKAIEVVIIGVFLDIEKYI